MVEKDRPYAALKRQPATFDNILPKVAFCYQKICLLFDGAQPTQMIYAMLDTGSDYTLIFESVLNELGVWFNRQEEGVAEFWSITNNVRFKAVGKRELCFHYQDIETKRWYIEAYILENPPTDQHPSFDILLGNDHIIPSRAIQGNPAVLGRNHCVSYRPTIIGLS